MKLSSRSRYGFRAILQLAMEYGKGRLQVKIIAKREDISSKYLEQLIATLKVNGLVYSIRGRGGGYLLSKHPSKIKLGEIFSALEGPEYSADCTKHAKFTKGCGDCITRHIWSKIHRTRQDLLDSMTLQDLVDIAEGKKKL